MKIDFYTKGILTVIALSLVVMAFKDVDPISKAFAHGGDVVHRIVLCDLQYECVDIVGDENGSNKALRVFDDGNINERRRIINSQ
jgi:hypothetical protein